MMMNNNQHSQLFFSPFFFTSLESILRLLAPLEVQPSSSLSLMGLPMVVKISETLQLSLAEHSTKVTPYFLARASPSWKDTCLSVSLQSTLLPTMILHMDQGCDSLICLIQFSRLLKDFLSVTEQTRTTPAAPLQQVSVMVLNLSWPAVSQICILILMPSILMVLILKSTPMVVTCDILYSSFTYRSRMFVLPTAVSPIITSFTRQSYFSQSLRLVILIIAKPQKLWVIQPQPNTPSGPPSPIQPHLHAFTACLSIPASSDLLDRQKSFS